MNMLEHMYVENQVILIKTYIQANKRGKVGGTCPYPPSHYNRHQYLPSKACEGRFNVLHVKNEQVKL